MKLLTHSCCVVNEVIYTWTKVQVKAEEAQKVKFFTRTILVNWRYRQVTTPDAFTFPEEILKSNTSLFWVLAVSKEMK